MLSLKRPKFLAERCSIYANTTRLKHTHKNKRYIETNWIAISLFHFRRNTERERGKRRKVIGKWVKTFTQVLYMKIKENPAAIAELKEICRTFSSFYFRIVSCGCSSSSSLWICWKNTTLVMGNTKIARYNRFNSIWVNRPNASQKMYAD